MTPQLYWLPERTGFSDELSALSTEPTLQTWRSLGALAGTRLDFTMTARLDRACQKRFGETSPPELETRPIRLAILGSSTTEHLVPGIRVGALRRNLWVKTFTGHYGQYMQEMLDSASALHQFKPNAVLFVFDASHLFGNQTPLAHSVSGEEVLDEIGAKLKGLWKAAQDHFGCHVIQQTVLPLAPTLLGQNEHRLALSQYHLTIKLNERLRTLADESVVDLLSLDQRVMLDGVSSWHDPLLWNKAKQEISPLAGPVYGDLVARILAAAQGRSAKCLVLDLDNTLWGGVIGDDGLEGIKLGQGSPAGEAFLAIQRYALGLSKCGVILAVCSKNDEANAFLPFDQHPEMPLKRSDIACFVANWDDKAANLREIARRLNIGIDALVFVDDNPFERNQVRREVPAVAVPELPEDPALYPQCLADAGYFERLHLTKDDLSRAEQYQVNLKREELKRSASDMEGYLESLQMELQWSPVTSVDLQRVVQLINKTNQFNLTTRRYTEAEVVAVLKDPTASTLQLRLLDRFGDNGIIAIVIGKQEVKGTLFLDTWLMSCRVLGRGVEEATLGLIVNEARRLGAHRLVGEYRPTAKNGMVSGHYAKLGFSPLDDSSGGTTRWKLETKDFSPAKKNFIAIKSIL
jgi:FkbH-like protein